MDYVLAFSSSLPRVVQWGLNQDFWEGHVENLIFLRWNQALVDSTVWHGAPSCWNMKSFPHNLFPSASICRQISLTYAFALRRPLTTFRVPTPLADIQPQTWIFPPPYFTVELIQSWWYLSPFLLLTQTLLEGISSKVDSSEKRTFPHSSTVQSFLWRHQSSLFFLWVLVKRGLLAATHPLNPDCWSFLLTVLHDTSIPVASLKSLFNILDVALRLVSERCMRSLFCLGVVEQGLPDLFLSFTEPVSSFSRSVAQHKGLLSSSWPWHSHCTPPCSVWLWLLFVQ